MATVVPPVTQNATGSKGPTAMVFLNMGGPSTTDEVEPFLSRLFVCVLSRMLCLLLAWSVMANVNFISLSRPMVI